MESLRVLNAEITACRACPRLVAWRERVAREKKPEYRDERYWGLPLPGFGDPGARVLVVGLAPAAHGGNRTGRMFTGDSSGNTLMRALHAAGFANRPRSESRDDGLRLADLYITAAVRCAPPGNKPTPREFANCGGYLGREFALLDRVRVVVALGGHAFGASLRLLESAGAAIPKPKPRFGHAVEHRFVVPGRSRPATLAFRSETGLRRGPRRVVLIGAYHPSRQNTNTGRLTQEMLDRVFRAAGRIARLPAGAP
ncbi:MAG: uracil-DNA glycosylase [Halobacteria archaeon]